MIRRPPRSTLFPYTSSSDLRRTARVVRHLEAPPAVAGDPVHEARAVVGPNGQGLLGEPRVAGRRPEEEDRKSTRLNSSHSQISYAVFCLKKKKQNTHQDFKP